MFSGEPYEGKPHVRFDEGSKGNRVMVGLSGILALTGRNGQGSHDLYTTTLLSYSTRNYFHGVVGTGIKQVSFAVGNK